MDSVVTSLIANQFILETGTYECSGYGFAYLVAVHQLRIRNITDSTTSLIGTQHYAAISGIGNLAAINGVFSITGTKTLELQHQSQVTMATTGFGVGFNMGESSSFAS